MANVFDVAKYILEQHGITTAMKLQKLVYYSQAWSLVWDEEPIFGERIEAWINGPVVRELWETHRGKFKVGPEDLPMGNSDALTDDERDTIKVVLGSYGDKSPQFLSDLTHLERPWNLARERAGVEPDERAGPEITLADMLEYYSSLLPNDEQAGEEDRRKES